MACPIPQRGHNMKEVLQKKVR